ncbi:MAG TPA: diguanylate cyclase [Azospira sp.]|nr:diguanylate cyclase [Azospira sp.]
MPRQSANGTWKPLVTVVTIVLVLAWSIAGLHVREVGRETEAAAQQRALSLARSHAEQAFLTLTIADEVLRHLRQTQSDDGLAAFRREAERLSGKGSGGPINRVTLITADGWAVSNHIDGESRPPVFLGDREHFLAAQRSTQDRLIVSEPIVGKTTGEWIMLFARPILNQGKFAGAVVVGFPTTHLQRQLDSADPVRERVTLLSPGGAVIVDSSGRREHIGKMLALAGNEGNAPFLHTSNVDGVARVTAVREVAGGTLRVVAGIDQRQLDEENARHTAIAFLPAMLLSLLLAPASLFIYRTSRAQQLAHEALQAETRRSRTVFETMGEGILLLDAEGIIGFASSRAGAWLPDASGQRFAAAAGSAGFELVREDGSAFADGDPVERRCLARGEDIDDAWLKRGSGSNETWLALRARAFRDGDGAVLGATLTLADRSAEHEQRMEATLSAGIIDEMQDSVMITDARGRILRVNPAFTVLTGFSAGEALGHTPNLLKSQRHDAAFYAAMWQALADTGHWSGRIWNRRKSGEEYCVWHSITSLRDVHGRIARFITVSRDITEQETRESELWQRANFDPLTGLANRARFADRLTQALASAQRNDHGLAVCYLDLDRFKPVNDTLGHAAGDALLRQAAQRMRSVLREEDTLARIGGDEFALLLPRVKGAGDVSRVAAKIIDLVHAPFDLPEGTASIGVSIGIVLFPEDGEDATTLGDAADRALYAAKAGGRNCWRFAERTEHADPEPETR